MWQPRQSTIGAVKTSGAANSNSASEIKDILLLLSSERLRRRESQWSYHST